VPSRNQGIPAQVGKRRITPVSPGTLSPASIPGAPIGNVYFRRFLRLRDELIPHRSSWARSDYLRTGRSRLARSTSPPMTCPERRSPGTPSRTVCTRTPTDPTARSNRLATAATDIAGKPCARGTSSLVLRPTDLIPRVTDHPATLVPATMRPRGGFVTMVRWAPPC